MSRTAHLLAAAGLTALLSATVAFTAQPTGGPGVIGWDTVRAAGPGVIGWDAVDAAGTGSQVISWD
ncbi:hypothetical protein [Streptomyces sp. NPDC088762]|uniref:hypothetical protein n=1 Tax=Streptomyces sp. NPDC088762 TaxID=3365891 RepID=UPI0037F346F8